MCYKCPCCGFYTLPEEPPGTYDICPVCFWEDSFYNYSTPDKICGCNHVSLNEARKNFAAFGACLENLKIFTRPPHENEKHGMDWPSLP